MCGILGTLPASENIIFNNALDKLIHRGPDGFDIWSDQDKISLGHRRLSIIDTTSNASQPMHFNNYVIVFNGEIYNFIEIKNQLLKHGFVFKTNSDTEVVLAAYQFWKEDCLKKFNGMWSIAIWDKFNNTLFISRDRFGKKPLFYSFYDGQFIFASEMKAITPFFKNIYVSPDFNWCKQNIFLYENTDKCLIKDIKRFPSGSYALIKLNDIKAQKINVIKFWDTLDELVQVPESYEEQVACFRELFIDSCKIRMRSDVPIGTALSGGLDSSATICAMSYINKHFNYDRVSKDWQHAFIATFKGSFIDEKVYADKVLDFLDIKGNYIELNGGGDFKELHNQIYLCEEIYITPPSPMIQTYKRVKTSGVSVTLDGHGADELLCGYNLDFYEALFDEGFDYGALKNLVSTRLATISENPKHNELVDNVKELIFFLTRIVGINVMHKLNDLGFINNFFRLPVKRYDKKEKLSYFNSMLYNRSHISVLPTLLRNYDRYSMAASVEVRMPFMDHRIVSFLLSTPWDSKIRGGYTKSILRDALDDIMPVEILERKSKIGFSAPISEWMQGTWKNDLFDLIHSTSFRNSNLINSANVSKSLNKLFQNKNVSFAESSYVWQELMPYFWEQTMLSKNSYNC
jgi:asparagine synthase (glutamine-hydrolysing)